MTKREENLQYTYLIPFLSFILLGFIKLNLFQALQIGTFMTCIVLHCHKYILKSVLSSLTFTLYMIISPIAFCIYYTINYKILIFDNKGIYRIIILVLLMILISRSITKAEENTRKEKERILEEIKREKERIEKHSKEIIKKANKIYEEFKKEDDESEDK